MHDDEGQLLIVRRCPRTGTPACGRCRVGGSSSARTTAQPYAVKSSRRPGLHVVVGIRVGTVQRPGRTGSPTTSATTPARWRSRPRPVAGDDASDVRWVSRVELKSLDLVDGLWDALREWGMLPT